MHISPLRTIYCAILCIVMVVVLSLCFANPVGDDYEPAGTSVNGSAVYIEDINESSGVNPYPVGESAIK